MDIRLGAVREEDIVFSATGHTHAGGADGENIPEAAVVFSATGHTHIGGAQGNTLGLDALKVDEQFYSNAAAITVLSSLTQVGAIANVTVVAGDRIFFAATMWMTKGVTAGQTRLYVNQEGGTAVARALDTLQFVPTKIDHAASNMIELFVFGIFKVTTGGTFSIGAYASSAGSNGTVAIADAQLYELILRGVG